MQQNACWKLSGDIHYLGNLDIDGRVLLKCNLDEVLACERNCGGSEYNRKLEVLNLVATPYLPERLVELLDSLKGLSYHLHSLYSIFK
jgi:hypothetical protein